MGIQKITFDGASVSAKIDADLYHFLFSNKIGILSGIKNSVSFTLSNSAITFQDVNGWLTTQIESTIYTLKNKKRLQ